MNMVKARYDEDVYAWSQEQAAAIRRLASGQPGLLRDLDLDHIAEEIEDVGASEVRTVESLLRQIMAHLIKAVSCPTADAVGHWRAEVTALHADLVTRYTPSMRRKIDLQKAWRLAVRQAQTALEAHGVTLATVPEPCPFSVAEMVEEPFTFEQGTAILANSLPAIAMRR